MNVSVLILTCDEAINLPDCLSSVGFSDDVVVLDSGSIDDTVELAEASGATVLNRTFDNYAAQRNFGLSHDFKHDWVLMLDADERIPDDFIDEIRSVTEQGDKSSDAVSDAAQGYVHGALAEAFQWLSNLVWAIVPEGSSARRTRDQRRVLYRW